MSLKDKINDALDGVRGLLRRRGKHMDAFGGDDLYEGDAEAADDDEDGKSGLANKIALAVSGIMLLALATLVGMVFFTGDKQAAQTGGTLAGLELVDETADTSASERSAERRPWLTPTDGGSAGPRRFGVGEDKPATPATGAKPEPAKTQTAAVTPPPTKAPETKTPEAKSPETKAPEVKAPETKAADATAPEPKAAEVKTAETKPVEPKAAEAKTADAQAPDAKPEVKPNAKTPDAKTPSAKTETKTADTKTMPPVADEDADEQKVAELPSLMAPAQTAPGAPRRFDNADVGAATAGGRPRLSDPRLPPTDRASVGAPPPRFSAVGEIKVPTADAKSAKLAIIVEGLGLNRAATEAALTKLPPNVTLAFSPYARDLKRLMDRAKAKGHEVLIEVPMESKAFPAEDPGPLGLLTTLEPKDNQERLDLILKEASGATGVFDANGSKFRESQANINGVLTKLKQQNLFYVQGRPGVRVGDTEIPSATADVVIDERPFRAAVDARFDFAEKLAKYQGSAVAVMGAKPISFERLALWSDQLSKKGVTIAPVSQVLVQ